MMDPETKLTPHFTVREMCASKSHPEIYNVPPLDVIDNLVYICQILEMLREEYSRIYAEGFPVLPLYINSGYRSKMLNKAVGGAATSAHLTGNAVDIRCKDCSQAIHYSAVLLSIFARMNVAWDEILIERKGLRFWVHFAAYPKNSKHANRCKVSIISC